MRSIWGKKNRDNKALVSRFMNGGGKAALILGVLSAASMGTASATDLLGNPVFEKSGDTTRVEYGTGWYIRGDIGFGVAEVEYTEDTGRDVNLGYPVTLSAGLGYKLGNNIRLESNYTQFANFEEWDTFAQSCGSERIDTDGDGIPEVVPITGNCYLERQVLPNFGSLMINAFYDLPAFGRVRPYVGAGAGLSVVSWGEVVQKDHCVGLSDIDCGENLGAGDNVLSESIYNSNLKITPSFGLAAGLSYAVTDQVSLDLGYRFTYMSGVKRYNGDDLDDDVAISDVRVGLRYEIW